MVCPPIGSCQVHQSFFNYLPDEVILNIFSNLIHRPEAFCELSKVNVRFSQIATDESLWIQSASGLKLVKDKDTPIKNTILDEIWRLQNLYSKEIVLLIGSVCLKNLPICRHATDYTSLYGIQERIFQGSMGSALNKTLFIAIKSFHGDPDREIIVEKLTLFEKKILSPWTVVRFDRGMVFPIKRETLRQNTKLSLEIN